MNIFSNIGITELVVILLLALLVVGPERLPEMARKLAKILRDLRRAYDNLTAELGPELTSIQQTTKELRASVESVTSIPRDVAKSVVEASELDDALAELKEVKSSLQEVGQTVSGAQKVVRDPIGAAVKSARNAIRAPMTSDSPGLAEPTDNVESSEAGGRDNEVQPKASPGASKEPSDE